MLGKTVFVAWRGCGSRTRILSKLLKAKLVVVGGGPPYVRAFLETVKALAKDRPTTVLLQTTQGPALLTIAILKKLLSFKVVLDVHANFLVYGDIKSFILNFFFTPFMLLADRIILHEFTMMDKLHPKLRDKAVVLVDPPPEFLCSNDSRGSRERLRLVFPSGGGVLERVGDVTEALLGLSNIELYVTGPHKPRRVGNIIFTGFLNYEDYLRLLCSSDLIVTWIDRDYTVTRDAIEALYLGRPIIAPDRKAFKAFFGDSAFYAKDMKELREVVERILKEPSVLLIKKEAMKVRRKAIEALFKTRLTELMTFLKRSPRNPFK
jgi:glycosyltransferase involved in cell wall biosynthesis